jgi:hypothetical protein
MGLEGVWRASPGLGIYHQDRLNFSLGVAQSLHLLPRSGLVWLWRTRRARSLFLVDGREGGLAYSLALVSQRDLRTAGKVLRRTGRNRLRKSSRLRFLPKRGGGGESVLE